MSQIHKVALPVSHPSSPAEREYYAAPPEEMPLRELWRKLWRQKLAIAATTAGLTLAAAVIVFLLRPEYTAVARIVIDARQADYRPLAKSDDTDRPYVDGQVIETQIQIIKSNVVIGQVIDRAHLDRNPEFNERLRPPSLLAPLSAKFEHGLDRLLTALGLDDLIPAKAGAPKPGRNAWLDERTRIVEAVKSKLDVGEEGLSSVVRIAFTSRDPQIAALVANSFAEFYIADQLAAKKKTAQAANEWVNQRVEELREEVQKAEGAVQAYVDRQGLIKTREGSPAGQEIAQLSSELARAQADRAAAEARLQHLTSLLSSSKGLESSSEVITSPLIIHLRQQEAQMLSKRAELTENYGARNPKMIDIEAAIADNKAKIRIEAERITEGVRNDVAVARARETAITARLDEAKRELVQLDNAEVKLRPLQREAEASRNLFEAFLLRSKQIVDQAQKSDAHVLADAEVPERPSFPRRGPLILLSSVGAFFAGLLLALWIDHLDPGFRSLEQAAGSLGLRPLALIPSLGAVKSMRKVRPDDYMLDKPRSRYGEAIRTLVVGLTERSRDARRAKIIMVASSLPHEGKTSLVLSMARFLAESGQRVLVIDCDLRKPSAHRAFKVENSPGLSEYLHGEAGPTDILRKDEHSSAALIPAGDRGRNPTMLLGSPNMRRLMRDVAGDYDWIIIDSSPVMAVADARLLARLADHTVFVARWAKTRRETAQLAVDRLTEAGADIAGVVLSRVDLRRHTQYSYGDPGYHRGGVARYYAG